MIATFYLYNIQVNTCRSNGWLVYYVYSWYSTYFIWNSKNELAKYLLKKHIVGHFNIQSRYLKRVTPVRTMRRIRKIITL